jgi:hypothetical protein
MAREWTDDEVQKEISEAVQIVREDRIDTLIRNRLSTTPANPDDKKDKAPESGGNPDDNSGGNAPAKRKSLWWGETDDLSANASKGTKCTQGALGVSGTAILIRSMMKGIM